MVTECLVVHKSRIVAFGDVNFSAKRHSMNNNQKLQCTVVTSDKTPTKTVNKL